MNADIEYLQNLVEEYQTSLPSLEDELTNYKRDNRQLRNELLNLDQENKMLSLRLEEMCQLSSKNKFSYMESEIMENLKSQLIISSKASDTLEKDSITVMWKNSLKRIEYLEDELKFYSNQTHLSVYSVELNKIKKFYVKRIKAMQNEFDKSQMKLQDIIKHSNELEQSQKQEIIKLSEAQKLMDEDYKQLESKYKAVSENNSTLETCKMELEQKLETQSAIVSHLKLESYNAKLKVAEACQVIEAALVEKDAALARENEAQEEKIKLMTTIENVMYESQDKLMEQLNDNKEAYCLKLQALRMQLKRSESDLEQNNIELEKRNIICKTLEGEIEGIRNSQLTQSSVSATEKEILLYKLDEKLKKLVSVEAKNLELSREHEELLKQRDNLIKCNESESKERQEEKYVLESKIKILESQLSMSTTKLLNFAKRVDELNENVSNMNIKFTEELKLKSAKSEEQMTQKIRKMEKVNKRANRELKWQLENQMTLNKKWKHIVKTVIKKLEDKLRELKHETGQLKVENNFLRNKLEISENICSEYKDHLHVLCEDFNNFAGPLTT